MKLNINWRQTTKHIGTKPAYNSILGHGSCWTCTRNYRAMTNGGKGGDVIIYAMQYQKVRKKMLSSKKITKVWNGKTVTTTKRTYAPAYWQVTVVAIPAAILKYANMRLYQHERSFIIIPIYNGK